ncbi:hypothetical protein J6590_028668 [Homalodisca vitripennis]|nr:hypothetical protein J6590_028668 [Homalodisca vitripennis]
MPISRFKSRQEARRGRGDDGRSGSGRKPVREAQRYDMSYVRAAAYERTAERMYAPVRDPPSRFPASANPGPEPDVGRVTCERRAPGDSVRVLSTN